MECHWHLNQIKSRLINEVSDTLVDGEPMEVIFDTFDVSMLTSETNIPKYKNRYTKRDSTLILKRKDIDSWQSNFKKGWVGDVYHAYEH